MLKCTLKLMMEFASTKIWQNEACSLWHKMKCKQKEGVFVVHFNANSVSWSTVAWLWPLFFSIWYRTNENTENKWAPWISNGHVQSFTHMACWTMTQIRYTHTSIPSSFNTSAFTPPPPTHPPPLLLHCSLKLYGTPKVSRWLQSCEFVYM